MICRLCGGQVIWNDALTHTKCKSCGARNSQRVPQCEPEEDTDDDDT